MATVNVGCQDIYAVRVLKNREMITMRELYKKREAVYDMRQQILKL